MKNKTKITCVADNSQAQPFKTDLSCDKCGSTKNVTVYPALGPNFFECSHCTFINTVSADKMEACQV